jgi:hypothetical protein
MRMSGFVSTGLYRLLNVLQIDTARFRTFLVLSYICVKVLLSKLWNMKHAN